MGRALVMAFLLGFFAGCQERVVNYKPFLSGLEGVQTQTPATTSTPANPALERAAAGDEFTLIRQNDDGTVTLLSKSGRHLMAHILRTLAEDEKGQFTEQVLSEITRAEYHERGRDPGEAFDLLKTQQREIAKLFNRMPMGEHSPNVIMESIGKNMFRVRVTGQSRKGLERWTGFDMVYERGNWRLRWFVP
jgi:hypothetical protein